ncbi:MAG: cyclase family protein [Bacteroidota bacterium]
MSVRAQTPTEIEPWWPHPLWGANDQAGGSNWITPAKILSSLATVQTGKVYELGYPYEATMPLVGNRKFELTLPLLPSGDSLGPDLVYNVETVTSQIGQVGTQFDGPGHIGKRITMIDGSTQDVYYNGVTSEEMESPTGLRKNGVEQVKPYITTGILIDIAAAKEVASLPAGYVVTLEDVQEALQRQGIAEEDIQPGDALLFNFGWWRKWPDPVVLGNGPGIGEEVANWVIEKQASMVGSDVITDEATAWVVHHRLMLQHGIWNLEFMNFEGLLADQLYRFLFIFTPLRFKGATGSPGRPIAIG